MRTSAVIAPARSENHPPSVHALLSERESVKATAPLPTLRSAARLTPLLSVEPQPNAVPRPERRRALRVRPAARERRRRPLGPEPATVDEGRRLPGCRGAVRIAKGDSLLCEGAMSDQDAAAALVAAASDMLRKGMHKIEHCVAQLNDEQ